MTANAHERADALSLSNPARIARARQDFRIAVIIPALNEEASLPSVLAEIPSGLVDEVIVVDNRSTDRTAGAARSSGATVIVEPRRGYGSACSTGVAYALDRAYDILVFLDADYSDYPEDMTALVEQVTLYGRDLVIGTRSQWARRNRSIPVHARFGNWIATRLLKLVWGVAYTDLGPFRAVRAESLRRLKMQDNSFGWTVEMQARGAKLGLNSTEIPVRYRSRTGTSKISGTLAGSVKAGGKILYTIARVMVESLCTGRTTVQ